MKFSNSHCIYGKYSSILYWVGCFSFLKVLSHNLCTCMAYSVHRYKHTTIIYLLAQLAPAERLGSRWVSRNAPNILTLDSNDHHHYGAGVLDTPQNMAHYSQFIIGELYDCIKDLAWKSSDTPMYPKLWFKFWMSQRVTRESLERWVRRDSSENAVRRQHCINGDLESVAGD